MLPRVRRNMSYDLRGDIPIPFRPVSPWNNPEVGPIINRPMNIGDTVESDGREYPSLEFSSS
jgi:hypothetical protein